MFWQVVLFIVIIIGLIILRALSKALEEVGEGIAMAVLSFIFSLGLLFYASFVIFWSLEFLIGFTGLSYWTLTGLLVLRNACFNKLDAEKED